MSPPKTVGIIAHTEKPGASLLVNLLSEFKTAGIGVLLEKATAEMIGGKRTGLPHGKLASRSDLLLVLGGDGSLLHALHRIGLVIKPMFGLNLGSLGFLTALNSSSYQEAVSCLAKGDFVVQGRTILQVNVKRRGKVIHTRRGLNDAVFSRGSLSRLIRLKTKVDGVELTDYNADGLIVATPTGSTAYSMAAGGPIVSPEAEVLLLTPICPHVLTNRTLIVKDTSKIEVTPIHGQESVYLTVDGQQVFHMDEGDVVEMTCDPTKLPLVMLPNRPFFEVLRQKLRWSGSSI